MTPITDDLELIRSVLRGYPQSIARNDALSALHRVTQKTGVFAEPLNDEQIEAATGAKQGTSMFLLAKAFTQTVEKAHGIK